MAMSEGKRRNVVDWRRLKGNLHSKINTREMPQQIAPGDRSGSNNEPAREADEHQASEVIPSSTGIQLTSTSSHSSERVDEGLSSTDSKQTPPSVSSAVKSVGDAIRFQVQKSWVSRGTSSTPGSDIQRTSVPTEFDEVAPPLPPRLPPEPVLNSMQSQLNLGSNKTYQANEGTTSTGTAIQAVPVDVSHQAPESSGDIATISPQYIPTLSVPTAVPKVLSEEVSIDAPVGQIDSELALIPVVTGKNDPVTAQQAQGRKLVASSSKGLCLSQAAQIWLNWSMVGHEIRVSIGTLPYVEEAPPPCELCEEHHIMNLSSETVTTYSGVHVCVTCGQFRILCERCARYAISIPEDPHEADHILQGVGSITQYSLQSFLNTHDLHLDNQDEPINSISRSWFESDLAFRARNEAATLLAHIFLQPPPGMHKMTVRVRVVFDEASISSQVMGTAAKQWMKMTRKQSGDIWIGTDVVSRDMPSSPGMPPNTVQNPIIYKSGVYSFSLTVTFADFITLKSDQSLNLHIKSTHDTSMFEVGCPFSWHLESVRMEQYGEGKYLATKGQLLKKEKDVKVLKVLEKRETRDRRIGYVGTAIGLGTGAAGLGPAAQGLGAVLRR